MSKNTLKNEFDFMNMFGGAEPSDEDKNKAINILSKKINAKFLKLEQSYNIRIKLKPLDTNFCLKKNNVVNIPSIIRVSNPHYGIPPIMTTSSITLPSVQPVMVPTIMPGLFPTFGVGIGMEMRTATNDYEKKLCELAERVKIYQQIKTDFENIKTKCDAETTDDKKTNCYNTERQKLNKQHFDLIDESDFASPDDLSSYDSSEKIKSEITPLITPSTTPSPTSPP